MTIWRFSTFGKKAAIVPGRVDTVTVIFLAHCLFSSNSHLETCVDLRTLTNRLREAKHALWSLWTSLGFLERTTRSFRCASKQTGLRRISILREGLLAACGSTLRKAERCKPRGCHPRSLSNRDSLKRREAER